MAFQRGGGPAILVGAALLALTGCVATGAPPQESIPPALLDSDLGILEAQAGTETDGLSVGVWASFVVERDELSADELREVLRIVVANTSLTNVSEISIIAQSDEIDPASPSGNNVYIALEPLAAQLGLEPRNPDGRGPVDLLWDDVTALLKENR